MCSVYVAKKYYFYPENYIFIKLKNRRSEKITALLKAVILFFVITECI